MSDDPLADVVDAVVARINGFTFDETVTTERVWVPDEDIKDLAGVVIPVVGIDDTEEVITRRESKVTFIVDIGILKRLSAEVGAPVDDMRKITGQIKTLFRFHKLMDGVSLTTIGGVPILDTERLDQSLYMGVIRLTYVGFVTS